MNRHPSLRSFASGLALALAAGTGWAQAAKPMPPVEPKLVSGPPSLMGKTVEELHKTMELLSADKKQPDFTSEKLNPVGGSLLLPRGWLLYEQHNSRSYVWMATMAPPNMESRGEARMRLMLQPQMLKTERRKPSIYTAAQVQELVKANPDIKACEPAQVGPWVKVCYEYDQVIDGNTPEKFRVRASMYYSDAMDLFAMTMFSTPADKWTKYAGIMAKMDQLEFFDAQKAAQPKAAEKPADKSTKEKSATKK